jgi:hypothetical protein
VYLVKILRYHAINQAGQKSLQRSYFKSGIIWCASQLKRLIQPESKYLIVCLLFPRFGKNAPFISKSIVNSSVVATIRFIFGTSNL